MARSACSRWSVVAGTLCALALSSVASAAIIPLERSRSVLSSSAIHAQDPAQISGKAMETFDRAALEQGFATNSFSDAEARSAAMMVSGAFDADGVIEARGGAIAIATMTDTEQGFAAALSSFTFKFQVTEEPAELAFNWKIWIGLNQLIRVEMAEVMLTNLSNEKVVSGATLKTTERMKEGTFGGELQPGIYELRAKALAVANTQVIEQERLESTAGYEFSFAIVPGPGSTALLIASGVAVLARPKRSQIRVSRRSDSWGESETGVVVAVHPAQAPGIARGR